MSSKPNGQISNIHLHNAAAWNYQTVLSNDWSRPVSSKLVAAAKNGQWNIHITKKPLPGTWLPKDIQNKDILCLASAGGQQAPILAAAGARVTVFDISEKQLEQDKLVAVRDNLCLEIIQGDMSDLSIFQDGSFDYIIHPISNLYVSDLKPVWKECHRVLRTNGILLSSFYNPVLFVFAKDKELEAKGLLKPQYSLPYADINELSIQIIEEKKQQCEALLFGHTLSSQINGQIEAGFLIAGFYEDEHPTPRFLIEKFMKTMIATKSVKY